MKRLPLETIDKYNEIIRILGEERIEKIHFLMGSEKFSIAAVKNIIKRRKIIDSIRTGESFRKIASQYGTSKMTVYRYLKREKKK